MAIQSFWAQKIFKKSTPGFFLLVPLFLQLQSFKTWARFFGTPYIITLDMALTSFLQIVNPKHLKVPIPCQDQSKSQTKSPSWTGLVDNIRHCDTNTWTWA